MRRAFRHSSIPAVDHGLEALRALATAWSTFWWVTAEKPVSKAWPLVPLKVAWAMALASPRYARDLQSAISIMNNEPTSHGVLPFQRRTPWPMFDSSARDLQMTRPTTDLSLHCSLVAKFHDCLSNGSRIARIRKWLVRWSMVKSRRMKSLRHRARFRIGEKEYENSTHLELSKR